MVPLPIPNEDTPLLANGLPSGTWGLNVGAFFEGGKPLNEGALGLPLSESASAFSVDDPAPKFGLGGVENGPFSVLWSFDKILLDEENPPNGDTDVFSGSSIDFCLEESSLCDWLFVVLR